MTRPSDPWTYIIIPNKFTKKGKLVKGFKCKTCGKIFQMYYTLCSTTAHNCEGNPKYGKNEKVKK